MHVPFVLSDVRLCVLMRKGESYAMAFELCLISNPTYLHYSSLHPSYINALVALQEM